MTEEYFLIALIVLIEGIILYCKCFFDRPNKLDIELNPDLIIDSDYCLLESSAISFDTIDNRKLGLIEVEHTTLKGALLFAPAMKCKVKSDIGYPFYAVIPVRDFFYIFSAQDLDFFSGRICKVVVDQYKQSGYSLTT